jgi:pre-rRNA-processing protein TSR3
MSTVCGGAVRDILILRDPRESTRKCSLTPLRGSSGVRFVEYVRDRRVDGSGRVLLHPDGELLGEADSEWDLMLLDCAWRRVPQLLAVVDGEPRLRRLPPLHTAYPRKSRVFQDPEQGLASIEALYAALVQLGRPRPELLERYRFRDAFLAANPHLAG